MTYLNFIECIELHDVLLIRVHYYADHDYLNKTFHIDILEKRAVHTWNFSLLRIFYRIVNGMCLFETSLYFFFFCQHKHTETRNTISANPCFDKTPRFFWSIWRQHSYDKHWHWNLILFITQPWRVHSHDIRTTLMSTTVNYTRLRNTYFWKVFLVHMNYVEGRYKKTRIRHRRFHL